MHYKDGIGQIVKAKLYFMHIIYYSLWEFQYNEISKGCTYKININLSIEKIVRK